MYLSEIARLSKVLAGCTSIREGAKKVTFAAGTVPAVSSGSSSAASEEAEGAQGAARVGAEALKFGRDSSRRTLPAPRMTFTTPREDQVTGRDLGGEGAGRSEVASRVGRLARRGTSFDARRRRFNGTRRLRRTGTLQAPRRDGGCGRPLGRRRAWQG